MSVIRTVQVKNTYFNRMKFLHTYNSVVAACFLLIVASIVSCRHDPPDNVRPAIDPAETQYPLEIAKTIVSKCAVAGCHNEASYKAAGSLRLDDWQYMFEGSSNGAVAVPYSPENSSLLYFINPGSYDALSVEPVMPFNDDPLSKEEYELFKKWITDGAPDKNGNIPFGSMPDTRQKVYLSQQGCDLLGVIDAEQKVIMRYIKIGDQPNIIENPHFVTMDRQGRYAYVCFTSGNVIQKIDTRTDKIVGTVNLQGYDGGRSINIVKVSPDGTKLIASQLISEGNIILIDAVNMQPIQSLADLKHPHGIAYNSTFDTFYITGQYGNAVYKLPITRKNKETISIDGRPIVNDSSMAAATPNPHEIIMAPDYSKYFLSCENTNEVRVIDRLADTVIKAIPVGIKPQEFAISSTMPYLFVTCMEDNSTLAGFKGSVYIINYNTLEVVESIYGTFFQPHGIIVDDKEGVFYIASRNSNPNGPAPHHVSDCGGRNGYYQVYDLSTLKPLNGRRYEVTPDPYSFDIRFK